MLGKWVLSMLLLVICEMSSFLWFCIPMTMNLKCWYDECFMCHGLLWWQINNKLYDLHPFIQTGSILWLHWIKTLVRIYDPALVQYIIGNCSSECVSRPTKDHVYETWKVNVTDLKTLKASRQSCSTRGWSLQPSHLFVKLHLWHLIFWLRQQP